MDPAPPDDWISALTRPLEGNHELHLRARHELAERSARTDPHQLDAIRERCREIDRIAPNKRRSLLLAALGGLLLIVVLLQAWSLYRSTRPILKPYPDHPQLRPADYFQSRLSPEDHFFVFGDTAQETPELASRALWLSDPDNPKLYGHYVAHCSPFPPDMVETAERIDPDNGWFLLLAAGKLTDACVEAVIHPTTGNTTWSITDEEQFTQALSLFQRAVAKPRIERYELELLRERLDLLPPEDDLTSRLQRMVFAGNRPDRDLSGVRSCLMELLSARSSALAKAGDKEALREWEETTRSAMKRILESDASVLGQIYSVGFAAYHSEALAAAQEDAGMTEEADQTRQLVDRLGAVIERDTPWQGRVEKHGGYLTKTSIGFLGGLGAPEPTADDLRPERMLNHTLLDRATLLLAAILFPLLAAAPTLLRRLRGRYALLLGKRLGRLLTWRDHLVIAGLGLGLPLAWLLGISWLTPLGCRDWGPVYADFQPFLTQYICTVPLIIVATLAAIRHRLRGWIGELDLLPPKRLWRHLPVLLAGAAIPVAGLIRYVPGEGPLLAAIALSAAALLWLAVRAMLFVCGPGRYSHSQAAVASALIPSLTLAGVLLLALLPLTHMAERYWITHDDFCSASARNHGLVRSYPLCAERLQSRLRDALNDAP